MQEYNFVAINYIRCDSDYKERFEFLFGTRAHEVDKMPGFVSMEVLKPKKDDDNCYLILSRWDNEECFKAWMGSPEFIEGHKRGFEDVIVAKKKGRKPPVTSDFKTYSILTR